MNASNPNVMVLFHANPFPFEPPILFKGQWTGILEPYIANVESNSNTNYFSMPIGEFDLFELIDRQQIPKPDFLFICLDATMPYLARNIRSASKNIFLCLGDTHHLTQPISRMLSYVASEKFDGIVFTNNVRHSHWFGEISDAEQFFEPGMFASKLNSLESQSHLSQKILNPPVFYGQAGQFHPRRTRLLQPLIGQGYIKHISGSTADLANTMNNSMASINVTLNSDLNSRVFEVAQTGCLLIMDELSISNGHGSVLIPGHNCLTFKSSNELEELVKDHDALNEIGPRIGANLKNEYTEYWSVERVRDRLALSTVKNTLRLNKFSVGAAHGNANSTPLKYRLMVYESLLELHRIHESIQVLIDSSNAAIYTADLSDLPRLKVVSRDIFLECADHERIYIKDIQSDEPSLFKIDKT